MSTKEVTRLRKCARQAIAATLKLADVAPTRKEEARLLQKCVDMHRSVSWPIDEDMSEMAVIADRAHDLYFAQATASERPSRLRPWERVDFLAYLRAAEMQALSMQFQGGEKATARDYDRLLGQMYPGCDVDQIDKPVFDFKSLTSLEMFHLAMGLSPWPAVPSLRTLFRASKWYAGLQEARGVVNGALPPAWNLSYEGEARDKVADLVVFLADLGPEP